VSTRVSIALGWHEAQEMGNFAWERGTRTYDMTITARRHIVDMARAKPDSLCMTLLSLTPRHVTTNDDQAQWQIIYTCFLRL